MQTTSDFYSNVRYPELNHSSRRIIGTRGLNMTLELRITLF